MRYCQLKTPDPFSALRRPNDSIGDCAFLAFKYFVADAIRMPRHPIGGLLMQLYELLAGRRIIELRDDDLNEDFLRHNIHS